MNAEDRSITGEQLTRLLAERGPSDADGPSCPSVEAYKADEDAVVAQASAAISAFAAERARDLAWLADRRNVPVSDLVREIFTAEFEAQLGFEQGRFARRNLYRS